MLSSSQGWLVTGLSTPKAHQRSEGSIILIGQILLKEARPGNTRSPAILAVRSHYLNATQNSPVKAKPFSVYSVLIILINYDNALWEILCTPWAPRVRGWVGQESIRKELCSIKAEVAGPPSLALESNQLSITEGRKDPLALDLITVGTLPLRIPPSLITLYGLGQLSLAWNVHSH